jgi:hypothetical protein
MFVFVTWQLQAHIALYIPIPIPKHHNIWIFSHKLLKVFFKLGKRFEFLFVVHIVIVIDFLLIASATFFEKNFFVTLKLKPESIFAFIFTPPELAVFTHNFNQALRVGEHEKVQVINDIQNFVREVHQVHAYTVPHCPSLATPFYLFFLSEISDLN